MIKLRDIVIIDQPDQALYVKVILEYNTFSGIKTRQAFYTEEQIRKTRDIHRESKFHWNKLLNKLLIYKLLKARITE